MQWPSFPVRRRFALASLALGCLGGARLVSAGETAAWQAWPDLGEASVTGVPTADTLALANGRTVRLAGLRTPQPPVAGRPAEPGFAAALAWLGERAEGRRIRLYGPAGRQDRFGRLVAHGLLDGPPASWLQAAMVAAGLARVYAAPDEHKAIVRALLHREALARAATRGVWRDPAFAIRDAARPDAIPDGFQLVEGRVLAIGESAASLYLNFGSDWRQDFTAVVERRDRDGFEGWLRALRALEGRRIRVRGAVFRRGGPAIRVRSDHAIELLEEL